MRRAGWSRSSEYAVWSGIARTMTRRKKKAAPVLIEDLRAILGALPLEDGELTLAARRDRALLLVGWAGALRRSEVAALTVDDVQIGPDGLVLRIARSKTDQEGEGLIKGLPHGEHPATCPIRALQAWLRVAGIERGPLFRSVDRHGNVGQCALSTDGVHRIVKRACGRVGLDAALYSGHSYTDPLKQPATGKTFTDKNEWRWHDAITRRAADQALDRPAS